MLTHMTNTLVLMKILIKRISTLSSGVSPKTETHFTKTKLPIRELWSYIIQYTDEPDSFLKDKYPALFPSVDFAKKELIKLGRQPTTDRLVDNTLRYRPHIQKRFSSLGGYAEGLSLAFSLMPLEAANFCLDFLTSINFFELTSDSVRFAVLAEASTYAKKLGNELSEYFYYIVNMEMLLGYVPKKQDIDFLDDVKFWVEGDWLHTIDESEDKFLEVFREGLKSCFSFTSPVSEQKQVKPWLEEFFTSPVGGGFFAKRKYPKLTSTNSGVKIKNTKNIQGLTLSVHELENMIYDASPQVAKVIQKQELGKVRAVINSNYELYLKMSYISFYLDQIFRDHPYMTMYYSDDKLLEMKRRIISDCESKNVKIPLDQGHFDHQQNFRMHKILLQELRQLLERYTTDKDWVRVFDALESEMLSGFVIVGNERVLYEKGVLSGWRWTAMLDSIYNYAEIYCARWLIKRELGYDPILELQCMGDDDRIVTSTFGEAILVYEAMRAMNFEINPKKFFIATDRDEYLRQFYRAGRVAGYPVRALGSILFRKPTSPDPPIGQLRLGEQLNNWLLLCQRGMDRESVLKHMRIDMARGNHIPLHTVNTYLQTPVTLGGAGLFEWDRSTIVDFSNEAGIPIKAGFVNLSRHISELLKDNDIEQNTLLQRIAPGEMTRTVYVTEAPIDTYIYIPTNGACGTEAMIPRYETKIDEFIADLLLREKRVDEVVELLSPESRLQFDDLLHRASKRLANDYLNKNLVVRLPPDFLFGRDFISKTFSGYQANCFAQLVSRWKPTFGFFRAMSLGAELLVRSDLRVMRPIIGE